MGRRLSSACPRPRVTNRSRCVLAKSRIVHFTNKECTRGQAYFKGHKVSVTLAKSGFVNVKGYGKMSPDKLQRIK
jgi:hypothetical protein